MRYHNVFCLHLIATTNNHFLPSLTSSIDLFDKQQKRKKNDELNIVIFVLDININKNIFYIYNMNYNNS
jgi:hypothetical protein